MKKTFIGVMFALMVVMLEMVSPALARGGLFTWSGRVDDKLEIAVRGRNVNYRRVTGNRPNDINYNFSSTMPDRNMDVRLERRNGRGSVNIIERPNRNNNYTTIVRIEDPQAGDDFYRFVVRWDEKDDNWNGGGNNGNGGGWNGGNNGGNNGGGWNGGNNGNGGGWSGGNVGNNEIRWSGRVDGTQDITIQGNDVKWFKVDGRGAWDVNYRVGSPLPYQQMNLTVNKRRGRGGAYVLLQPTRQNNYQAKIRIVDKDDGDDFYDISIRW